MYKIFSSLFLLVIPLFSFGQALHSGLKAGMGGAFFKNTDAKDEYTFAYSVGGFLNYTINKDKSVSIQTELLFSRKGGVSKTIFTKMEPYPLPDEKLNYDLNYIEIPLMIKYSARGEFSRVYLMAGISPSFFLNGKARFDIFNGSEIKDVRSFDVGWVSTLGVEYNISRVRLLFLEARINNGLSNVFEHSPIRNFTYGLMSGIRF